MRLHSGRAGVDMEDDFFEVTIENISVSNLGFIVFLKKEADPRVLPIFIGANEAHSIAVAFNKQEPPRPLTHDLLKNILTVVGCEVTKVQVTALEENTFYGRIFLEKEGLEDFDIDSRPSDAIALALRYEIPIYVHTDVFESASLRLKEQGEENDSEGEDIMETEAAEAPKGPQTPTERIQERLEKAVKGERYEEAAKLRDELKRLQQEN